jgi:hypothetical protein
MDVRVVRQRLPPSVSTPAPKCAEWRGRQSALRACADWRPARS